MSKFVYRKMTHKRWSDEFAKKQDHPPGAYSWQHAEDPDEFPAEAILGDHTSVLHSKVPKEVHRRGWVFMGWYELVRLTAPTPLHQAAAALLTALKGALR